ncbi:MAG: hypothetical protein AB1486_18170 [Planctomycetota bacterium]
MATLTKVRREVKDSAVLVIRWGREAERERQHHARCCIARRPCAVVRASRGTARFLVEFDTVDPEVRLRPGAVEALELPVATLDVEPSWVTGSCDSLGKALETVHRLLTAAPAVCCSATAGGWRSSS